MNSINAPGGLNARISELEEQMRQVMTLLPRLQRITTESGIITHDVNIQEDE